MITIRSIYGRVPALIEPDVWNDEQSVVADMRSLERWGDRRFAKANRELDDTRFVRSKHGIWLPVR